MEANSYKKRQEANQSSEQDVSIPNSIFHRLKMRFMIIHQFIFAHYFYLFRNVRIKSTIRKTLDYVNNLTFG